MVAPRILWRYILRDVFAHALLGLAVMSLLLVVQNLLRFVEELVVVGVGLSGMLRLVAVILPTYLAYAIPTSLLFGVLLSFGRMSADGEIVAIRASGISVARLLPPVLALAAVATLATGYLLWQVEPQSRIQMKQLVREFAKTVRAVRPGEFQPLGKRMIYVYQRGDEACPLRGVLISDFSDPERSFYISARCGSIVDDGPVKPGEPESSRIDFVLEDGSIHFSDVDDSRYRKIRFARMHTTLDLSAYVYRTRGPRDYTFAELIDLERRLDAGEVTQDGGEAGRAQLDTQIHVRLAFPLASMLLAIVAVPMGIRPLRAGRSAGALTAIGVMTAYWCLFSAGEVVAESGYAPAWLAVWTPDVIVLGIGIWLVRRTTYGDT